MPTQWQNRYTELSNVNSGNELQNGDDVLAQHVNVALENGAYVKGIADTNANNISTLQGNVSTLQGDISSIEGDITDIEGDITSLDQRLTNLGFRYPSSTQSIALYGGGYLVGYINVLGGSANTSREGNRVILSLRVELNAGSSTAGQGRLFTGTTATSTATIPEEYRPKTNTTFYVPAGTATYQMVASGGTVYTFYCSGAIEVTAKTDGTFTMSMPTTPSGLGFSLSSVTGKTTLIKVGYQANPIS